MLSLPVRSAVTLLSVLIPAQGRTTTDHKQVILPGASESSCDQYVLLTSQRSGSAWTCQVLDAQDGMVCGRKPLASEAEFKIPTYSLCSRMSAQGLVA